jgi:hypothetical protein
MIDPREGAECERSDGVVRTRDFDSAAVDDNEVRRTTRRQATDVIATQELRSVSEESDTRLQLAVPKM